MTGLTSSVCCLVVRCDFDTFHTDLRHSKFAPNCHTSHQPRWTKLGQKSEARNLQVSLEVFCIYHSNADDTVILLRLIGSYRGSVAKSRGLVQLSLN